MCALMRSCSMGILDVEVLLGPFKGSRVLNSQWWPAVMSGRRRHLSR